MKRVQAAKKTVCFLKFWVGVFDVGLTAVTNETELEDVAKVLMYSGAGHVVLVHQKSGNKLLLEHVTRSSASKRVRHGFVPQRCLYLQKPMKLIATCKTMHVSYVRWTPGTN